MAMWFYHEGLKHMAMGDIVWKAGSGSTFNVCLLAAAYALDATKQRTHDAYADISANEVSSDNYVAGGAALTPADPTIVDDTGYKVYIMQNHASTVWAGPCTFTARYAVIYLYHATPANAYLIAAEDFEADKSCAAGSFTINWDDTTTFKIAPAIFA